MTGHERIARGYTVRVRQDGQSYQVAYVPRVVQNPRGNGEIPPQAPPPFEVAILLTGNEVEFRWLNAPADRDVTREEFERDAAERIGLLHDWLARLSSLVRTVETWAKELGWSTRLVEKQMEDSRIGKYKTPGLLMQEGVDRVLLEPIGRSAPGIEGVVDLYLMPAYDDIATLYFYDNSWHLHTASSRTAAIATVRDAVSKPLSREALQEVLAGMREHAS